MKKWFLSIALLLTVFVSPSFAQGLEVGIGVALPTTGRTIVTGAQVDSFGILRANSTLDSGPQLFVEIHKPFKVGEKFAVGPMIAFTPKIDLGTASNTQTTQPIAGGVGIAFQVPSKLKQHINIGVAYMVTQPIVQLADGYADGFQVPRGSNGQPLGVQFKTASLSRIMLTMSVSGWFK